MRRCSGRRGHQAGDAVKRLPAAILEAAAMTGGRGGGKALAAPDGGTNHRDLVELVTAIVMAQSGRAGARSAATAPAAFPSAAVPAATAAAPATPAAAAKRLHQPLGAWRHSTEVIQPSGLFFFLSSPNPPRLQARRYPPTHFKLHALDFKLQAALVLFAWNNSVYSVEISRCGARQRDEKAAETERQRQTDEN